MFKRKKPKEKKAPNEIIRKRGDSSAQYEMFAHAYIKNHFNSLTAFKEVFPEITKKYGNAKLKLTQRAYLLRNDPEVSKIINTLVNKKLKKYSKSSDEIIKEIAIIAFCNIGNIIDFDKKKQTMTINSINEMGYFSGAVKSFKLTPTGLTVDLYNKMTALELLGKHLGMFDKKEGETIDSNDLKEVWMDLARKIKYQDTIVKKRDQ